MWSDAVRLIKFETIEIDENDAAKFERLTAGE